MRCKSLKNAYLKSTFLEAFFLVVSYCPLARLHSLSTWQQLARSSALPQTRPLRYRQRILGKELLPPQHHKQNNRVE
jgi:hypothetical protein